MKKTTSGNDAVVMFDNFRDSERMRLEADATAVNCFESLVDVLEQDNLFLISTDNLKASTIVEVGYEVGSEKDEMFTSMYEEYKQQSGEDLEFSLFLKWFITSPFFEEGCPIVIGGDDFNAAVNYYSEMCPNELGLFIEPPSEEHEGGRIHAMTTDDYEISIS